MVEEIVPHGLLTLQNPVDCLDSQEDAWMFGIYITSEFMSQWDISETLRVCKKEQTSSQRKKLFFKQHKLTVEAKMGS